MNKVRISSSYEGLCCCRGNIRPLRREGREKVLKTEERMQLPLAKKQEVDSTAASIGPSGIVQGCSSLLAVWVGERVAQRTGRLFRMRTRTGRATAQARSNMPGTHLALLEAPGGTALTLLMGLTHIRRLLSHRQWVSHPSPGISRHIFADRKLPMHKHA